MRIDLPLCKFKYCRYNSDCNCVSQNRFDSCEYKTDLEEAVKLTLKKTEEHLYSILRPYCSFTDLSIALDQLSERLNKDEITKDIQARLF